MSPSTIEIIGPESIVNATEQIYTTRLNVSNAETNFSTETSYQQLNKLLTVVDEGPFKAEVTVKPKIIEKEYDSIKIEVLYLDTSFELAEPLPLVSIKLSGAMPVLENYIPSKHEIIPYTKNDFTSGDLYIQLKKAFDSKDCDNIVEYTICGICCIKLYFP